MAFYRSDLSPKADLYFLYTTIPKLDRIFKVIIENKFVELQEEVADETRQAAERLASDPVVNEPPADES